MLRSRADAPLTVLLLGGHELLRLGLRTLLEGQGAVKILGEAETIADAAAMAARWRPALVLAAGVLPDGDAAEACRRIGETTPGTRLAVLSDATDESVAVRAIAAGAGAHLSTRMQGPELCRALRAVAAAGSPGRSRAPRAVSRRPRLARDDDAALSTLTAQERRVLQLVAEGKTNRQIGTALGLREKTVKNYLSHAFEKLGVSRRSRAAVLFVRHRGALDPAGLAGFGAERAPSPSTTPRAATSRVS